MESGNTISISMNGTPWVFANSKISTFSTRATMEGVALGKKNYVLS